MDECRVETSELQASFMMSTPLWSDLWSLCNVANSAGSIQIQHIAGIMYVGLPKGEMNQSGDLVRLEVAGERLFKALSDEPPFMVNGAGRDVFV